MVAAVSFGLTLLLVVNEISATFAIKIAAEPTTLAVAED
jgi:hypothetical protein